MYTVWCCRTMERAHAETFKPFKDCGLTAEFNPRDWDPQRVQVHIYGECGQVVADAFLDVVLNFNKMITKTDDYNKAPIYGRIGYWDGARRVWIYRQD